VAGCYCSALTPIVSRTRVVFLQHPRERRVAVGTCRMAHLALPNSELHVGVSFEGHARVEALAAEPRGRVAVLFPGGEAWEAATPGDGPPRTVVVPDGTWSQARKLLSRNPTLGTLPRIGIAPARAGAYRIRTEPAAHCLSTVEAVAELLGQLEGDRGRFLSLLRPFQQMVERQLAYAAVRPHWHVRKRRRRALATSA
jgi:DTW domain-containing protein YfiP